MADSFTITAADGSQLEIPPREWFIDSKARARKVMKSHCFSPPARIYAYLTLATMAFKQELAVKMEAGKQVPVQPVDICAATGVSRRNFRKEFRCLETHGLAKIEGWTKGRFRVYSYAVPLDVDPQKIVFDQKTIFAGCPPELAVLLKHFRISFSPDIVFDQKTIQELQDLAQKAKDAEIVFRSYANCLRRAPHINKEERNERNNDDGGGGGEEAAPPPTPPPPEPLTAAPPPEPEVLLPASLPLEPEAALPVAVVVAEPMPTHSQGVEQIRQRMAEYGPVTPATAAKVLEDSRKHAPQCTAAEVCQMIDYFDREIQAGVKLDRIRSPIGLLIRKIPAAFEGNYHVLLEAPAGTPALPLSRKMQQAVLEHNEGLAILRAMRVRERNANGKL